MQTEPIAAAGSRSDIRKPRAPKPRPQTSRAQEQLAHARAAGDFDRPLQRRTLKDRLNRQALKEGLAPSRLAVLLRFIDCWQPDRPLYPRIAEYIAPESNVSPSTAYECIKDLHEAGILLWEQRRDEHGHNRSSLYWFTPEFFERAGVPFFAPPYSDFAPRQAPKFRHKRDPSSISDPSSFSGSVNPCINGRELRAPARRRPVIRSNEDPAVVDLVREHAKAHAAHYREAIEQSGQEYGARLAGTIAPRHRNAIAVELRNLAGRAREFARTQGRYDLTDDAIRGALTRRIVQLFFEQTRPYLLEKRHPIGCLWTNGGDDGTPCDLFILGLRALEEWCADLDEAPPRAPLVAPPSPEDVDPDECTDEPTADEIAEARAVCEELRARVAAALAPPRPESEPTLTTEPELTEGEPDEPTTDATATPHEHVHVRRGTAARVESEAERSAREGLRASLATFPEEPAHTAAEEAPREHMRRGTAARVESEAERSAREELRASLAAFPEEPAHTAAGEAPREHMRRGTAARVESEAERSAREGLRASLAAFADKPSEHAPLPPPRTTVRAFALPAYVLAARAAEAQRRASLARIGEETRREALTRARAARALHPRGGRARLPTHRHARGAFLAALARLLGPLLGGSTWSTTRATTAPAEEPHELQAEAHRAPPPRLCDVRMRPNERAPRRRLPPRRMR